MSCKVKKILCAALAVTMVIAQLQTLSRASNDELLMGDVNLDGTVDCGDASYLLQYSAGLIDLSIYRFALADLNGDRQVNTGDAQMLLLYSAGIISTFYEGMPPLIADFENPFDQYTLDYSQSIGLNSSEVICFGLYSSYVLFEPTQNLAFGVGYTIELDDSSDIIIETFHTENRLDTKLYLLDESCNVVTFDDDNGSYGGFSRIIIKKESGMTGTYKLLVCGYDINATGEFALGISSRQGSTIGEPTDPPLSTASMEPTLTPMPTPTATPTPTSTSTPDVTNTPSPSPTYFEGFAFTNMTVPENGVEITYNKPYTLSATVQALSPIESIRAQIIDIHSSLVELSASSNNISAERDVYSYSLSSVPDSIDSRMPFATLAIGEKTIEIYASTVGGEEQLIFSGSFTVLVKIENILHHTYNGSRQITDSDTLGALSSFFNSLDRDDVGAKALLQGLRYIGTPYGTNSGQLDCSWFVQHAYLHGAGLSLPRIASEQARYCFVNDFLVEDEESLIPGDLVFHRDKSSNCNCGRFMEIHHVAMFLGEVNEKRYFIESSSSRGEVCIRVFWGSSNYNSSSDWYIPMMGRPR